MVAANNETNEQLYARHNDMAICYEKCVPQIIRLT